MFIDMVDWEFIRGRLKMDFRCPECEEEFHLGSPFDLHKCKCGKVWELSIQAFSEDVTEG